MLTLGATFLYISAISVRVSVMEAAAKTTRSTLSAFASPWVPSVVVSSVLLLQAARENTSASARSRDKSFFMFGYFLSKIFLFRKFIEKRGDTGTGKNTPHAIYFQSPSGNSDSIISLFLK